MSGGPKLWQKFDTAGGIRPKSVTPRRLAVASTGAASLRTVRALRPGLPAGPAADTWSLGTFVPSRPNIVISGARAVSTQKATAPAASRATGAEKALRDAASARR